MFAVIDENFNYIFLIMTMLFFIDYVIYTPSWSAANGFELVRFHGELQVFCITSYEFLCTYPMKEWIGINIPARTPDGKFIVVEINFIPFHMRLWRLW